MDTHTMQHGRGGEAASSQHASHQMRGASYTRFAAMIATSTMLGFVAMYLHTYELGHVAFSWTRVFMAMIMGGVMTAVMMLFMWGMYPDKKANAVVLLIAGVFFAAGLALVRTQATVNDVAYMKAMIPHHSIAILTSERARIEDPDVRKLAAQIVETQRKEIEQMKALIARVDQR